MNRLLTATIVLLTATMATAQDRFADVQVEIVPVRDNINMLMGAGGNIGLINGDDGILMIDNQFAPLAPKIRAAIEKIQAGAPNFIINTHFHGDHTGGNGEFGKDGYIIGHDTLRERLAKNSRTEPQALPVITFAESITVHFNGDTLNVIHFPAGHTDTDSVIFFEKANVIHMGDHFFNGAFPFIDLGSGGAVQGYIDNVAKVLSMIDDDTKIIPGHGPLATKADLQSFHEALIECRDIVQKQIDDGKDMDAVRETGMPDKYAAWGEGFVSTDRWVATLYRGLGGE